MYEAHFGLARLPFGIAPDSYFYVDAPPHRVAVRALLDRLRGGDEFIPLIGEFGVGKTTVAQRMLEEVDRTRYVAGELPRMRIDGDDLLARVAEALGMREAEASHPLGGLMRQLEDLAREARGALLLVDEAHQLGVDALKRLRKLTAVRVEGRAALQVCLVGRAMPPGVDALQRSGRPLNIGPLVRVEPLDATGTREYILERLRRAGWTRRPPFDDDTTAEIHARCRGNPGRINRLCEHVLLQLFVEESDVLNPEVVRTIDELLQTELGGEPAAIAQPPRARETPDLDTLAEEPPAVAEAAAVLVDAPLASRAPANLPALRLADAGLVVPALEAGAGSHDFKPQRRGLAQAVAALALLVSGGVLWQGIRGPAMARLHPAREAVAPAASSVAATALAAPDAAPVAPAPGIVATAAPAGLAGLAEQTLARSPTAAGPAAAPATEIAAAAPVAAVTPVRAPEPRRRGTGGGRDGTHRRTLPADERETAATIAPAAAPVAAMAACTLEGEALGLCTRARVREPARAPAPEPAAEPVRAAPPRPSCEPTRAALGLCPDGARAGP